ncbi:MAG: hypothetical protein CL549_15860 [Alcanivorax sp.]|nr:hypothetical protein [Alcanivorax sp.]MAY11934.1 hypothetical protein [Alcanivorax sp.]MBI56750.1 hypothetical protein [Alcanivorax sp.]MBM1145615.1 hypothetical protein [Alcanivorax sp. ZXX171]|tara:strand:+ start:34902 stop:35138 length:237 start_codon:yes stop_codon:yes gene_type:complete
MNHRDRLHNARRAFQRAPTTADHQAALQHSGQLLERYSRDLPDDLPSLRTRQALTEYAERYLARCRRAATRSTGAPQQ